MIMHHGGANHSEKRLIHKKASVAAQYLSEKKASQNPCVQLYVQHTFSSKSIS